MAKFTITQTKSRTSTLAVDFDRRQKRLFSEGCYETILAFATDA